MAEGRRPCCSCIAVRPALLPPVLWPCLPATSVLLGLTELSETFRNVLLALWPLLTLSFASNSKKDKGDCRQAAGSGISFPQGSSYCPLFLAQGSQEPELPQSPRARPST